MWCVSHRRSKGTSNANNAGQSVYDLESAAGVACQNTMPRLVEYASVVKQMQLSGFRCLYHNSGDFGFSTDVVARTAGWIARKI